MDSPLYLDDEGHVHQGSCPFRDHPYLRRGGWHAERVIGAVPMPDASMRPLFMPGQLVFYAEPASTVDRIVVVRYRGRLLVRHAWRTAGIVLAGTALGYGHNEPGAVELAQPPGWRSTGPRDVHPELDVLGVAVRCNATYTAYVTCRMLDRATGRLDDDQIARALYGPDGSRDPTASEPGRRLPSLFSGSAN